MRFNGQNYRPLPHNLTVAKSSIDGLGLIATTIIPKNTYLGMTHISVITFPDWIRTALGGFLNHSEKPNCRIEYNFFKTRRYLYTNRTIDSGEELTVYYSLREYIYEG